MKFIRQIRHFSHESKTPFYVTSPIFYANAAPHIGHLYTAVITDALTRFQRLINPDREVFFCTGTDEHGSKIQQAAQKNGLTPAEYCDQISMKYKNLFREAGVMPSRFIRTTDADHKVAVAEFWKRLVERDLIYKTKYSGWYCVPDENFLNEKETKVVNGVRVSEDSGHPVEWTEEENYMFKLSRLQSEVVRWAQESNRIKPAKFQKILLDQLSDPLPDISVSRPATRVSWGINVPTDTSQTVYVWLDALVNYLTAVGFGSPFWPPVHVIGKDILKFHGIYWPAFLIGADMEPPRQLFVHSHWTVDGQKMSKSKLNFVDPVEKAGTYTMEGMRYFLLREGVPHSDGNYSETKIQRILNAELADTFGNLLSRASAKTLNPRQVFPIITEEPTTEEYRNLKNLRSEMPLKCLNSYDSVNFYQVVDTVIAVLHANNRFFEVSKPWELKNDALKRETVLSVTLETLRQCAIILQPVIPDLCDRVLTKLNVKRRLWMDLEQRHETEIPLGDGSAAVFMRIKSEDQPHQPQKKLKTKKVSQ